MAKEQFVVHTGLYGPNAFKTIDLLVRNMLGQGYDYRVKDDRMAWYRTGRATTVEKGMDGEVLLKACPHWRIQSEWYGHCAYDICREDAGRIRAWFANAIDQLYRPDNFQDNETRIKMRSTKSCLPSRIWELKATRDALLGKDIKALYGEKIEERVVGAHRDAVAVELNQALADEAEKITKRYRDQKFSNRRELDSRISEMRRAYRKQCAELDKQCRREISAMRKDALGA